LILTRDGAKQRRFSGTIVTDHTDSIAFIDSQVHTVQNLDRTEGPMDILESNQFSDQIHTSRMRVANAGSSTSAASNHASTLPKRLSLRASFTRAVIRFHADFSPIPGMATNCF